MGSDGGIVAVVVVDAGGIGDVEANFGACRGELE